MTPLDFYDKVDYEGGISSGALSYFGRDIQHDTDDVHLIFLWREAYDAVEALEAHLEVLMNEELKGEQDGTE